MRNFQLPGRSPVMACNAMAATSHPLATQTALKVLQEGGNAVDAALAANAVLCVVEPQMTGIGGDCFVILHQPDGSIHGLNGSGRAAKGAHLDWYLERGITDFSALPAHAVTVPGALKAWDVLRDEFGTQDLKQLFADAISYARQGFPVAPRVAYDWKKYTDTITNHHGARQHLLREGQAPQCGDVFKQPALANTLETIARQGINAFYTGPIAQEIAETVQAEGGFLTEEDLAAIEADWVAPISTNYRGFDVLEIPPNGQGITALVLLKLLAKLEARKTSADSPQRFHLEIEAGRLAYAMRDAYVSDPTTMNAKVEQLLSDQHIAKLAAMCDGDRRNHNITLPDLPNSSTVYLTVVDRDLRAVSFINSLYSGFGSGIVTPQSGICLQDRGRCFSLVEGHDNAIGPGKRPMHTIIPGMVTKNDKLAWSFGVMGGAYQPMGHAHVLSNMIDHGMDEQEALDHGRVFWDDEGTLDLEAGISTDIATGLENRGHKVQRAASPHGAGQIIGVDHKRGVMIGASDPRKDGMASGF